jgi:fermentation-respiration switch protein FrsA (DUF1100 family)
MALTLRRVGRAVFGNRRTAPRTGLLLVFFMALIGLLRLGCANRAVYYPTHEVYGTPADEGLRYEEVTFPSRDGTALSGWFMPALGAAQGTVVHFHGNAQNMTSHFSFVSWLPRAGFNVFVCDYRGYGASAGSPSREGVYEDCIAALNYVRARPDVEPDRIVVLGQSLGGANAIAVLGEPGAPPVRAVAVDSAFYSYRLMARDTIRKVPILSLLRWPLSFLLISDERSPGPVVGGISPTPLLIFHGTDDQVVPYRQGRMLYDAAEEPKELVTIPGGHHTDAFTRPEPVYRQRLVEFYRLALGQQAGAIGSTPALREGDGRLVR